MWIWSATCHAAFLQVVSAIMPTTASAAHDFGLDGGTSLTACQPNKNRCGYAANSPVLRVAQFQRGEWLKSG
jgi:hypothetical protein